MTDRETEELLRHALAESSTRVQPRPALHLIRMRTASAAATAEALDHHPRKD